MKSIIALFFILGASLANAETFPSSLPIRDVATLQAYAMEQVAYGSVSVYGLTVHYSEDTYRVADGNDDAVIKELWSKPFPISVTNPKDSVNYWVSLVDHDWNQLFWGHASILPQRTGNIWSLPAAAIDLFANKEIPIPVGEDVDGAQIVLRYNDGSIEYVYLEVYDGKLYFPVEYAGMNGELILTAWLQGGRYSQGYTLAGQLIPNTSPFGSMRIGIKNAFFYTDEFAPSSTISTNFIVDVHDDADRRPCVLKIKVTSPKSANIFGYVWDHVNNEIVFPSLAYIRKRGESVITEVQLQEWRHTTVLLQPGEYYITFPDFEPVLSLPADIGKG